MGNPRPTPAAYAKLALLLVGLAGSLAYLAPNGEYDAVVVGGVVKEKRTVYGFPLYPWYERVERFTDGGPQVTTTFRWYTLAAAVALGLGCVGVLTWKSLRPGTWVRHDGTG